MLRRITLAFTVVLLATVAVALAQDQKPRPLSPDGSASAQVLGKWVKGEKPAGTVGGRIAGTHSPRSASCCASATAAVASPTISG